MTVQQPDPSPARVLDVLTDLDNVIAATPAWRRRKVIWRTRNRVVGESTGHPETGRFLVDDGTPYRWGFTRPQCVRLAEAIRAAFRAEFIQGAMLPDEDGS